MGMPSLGPDEALVVVVFVLYVLVEMYRQFQHDVCRLRLEAARAYASVLQKGLSPISIDAAEPVRLRVEVSSVDTAALD